MKKFSGVFIVLWLLTAGMAMGAPLDSQSPAALGALEEARTAADGKFKAGEYEEAYQMYVTLLQTYPEHNGLLLGLARSGMMSGHTSQALSAYETLRNRFPNDLILHQEVSTAYAVAGDMEMASRRSQINVVDGDGLPAPDEILMGGTDDQRLQIHGRLSFGLMYDSNANNGPASSILRLGQFPYPIDIGHSGKEKGTMAAYFGANLDLGYRLNDMGNLWWVSSGNFYIRANSNPDLADIGSREWQWGKLNSGLRYIDDKNFVDVRIKGEVFDYELNSRIYSTGPEFTYARVISPQLHLITQLGIDYRDYVKDNARDGIYLNVGEYARIFLGETGHSLTVGARYRGGFADRVDFSYNGWEASGRLNLRLPYNFELNPFISYGMDYYKGPATALEQEDREDKRFSVGLGLTYRIDQAWSAELVYQFVDNNSESNFYDYDQHVISCGMAYSF